MITEFKKKQIKFRIFLLLILVGLVGLFFYIAIIPTGKINYIYDFAENSNFIGELLPRERVRDIEIYQDSNFVNKKLSSQKIIGNPVYFSLRTPRKFKKAKIIFKYRYNKENIKVIEAGMLTDKIIWRYDLQPIENKIINQLSLVWDVMKKNGTMLLYRNKEYDNIDEFLNNLPNRDEVALYNYDLKKEFLLDNYFGQNIETDYNIFLRGSYQFLTYIKNENLDFNFIFQDINKNKDSDPIDLYLYYNDCIIDSIHIADDGIINKNNARFNLANLPEGIYKIEIHANDDIITENIVTKQQKLSFINKIQLFKQGKSDIRLWTDSKEVHIKTIYPDSLQIVKLGEKEIKIKETYKQFSSLLNGNPYVEIRLEKDGIVLAGDGVFSFNENGLINSNFKKVDSKLDISKQGVNYVFARYDIPVENNNWKIAEANFDLTKAYSESGQGLLGLSKKYSFLISIPDLFAYDDIDDWVEIDEIRVELKGLNLFEKINVFTKAFKTQ